MGNFDKSLKTLEYDKIRKIVSSLAATEGAAEAILNLVPSDDIVAVNRLLDETAAAVGMITLKGAPPFGGVKNIAPAVDRAEKGAVLTPRELLDIALPFPDDIPMHDQWLGLLAARHGKVAYIDRPLMLYRRHAGTVTGRGKAGMLTRLKWRLCIAKDLLLYGGRQAHGRD